MKPVVLAILLATATARAGTVHASAAPLRPSLHVSCSLPSAQNIVLCRLSGSDYRPLEHLSVTYRVTFLALPSEHGKRPALTFHREGACDRQGRLTRPPLGFAVVPGHESYQLMVRVRGSFHDSASVTFTAIAQ